MKEGERVKTYFGRIAKTVKDIVFPVFCLACGKEGCVLCDLCRSSIDASGVSRCPGCAIATTLGACCPHCAASSSLDAHMAITMYRQHELIGRIMHAYKYQYVSDMSVMFTFLVQTWLTAHSVYVEKADAIVPVPLFRRRYAERGFNQSFHIAEMIARHTHRPVLRCLSRIRDTGHQAKLKRDERFQNVRGAFVVKDALAAESVMLVDDVFTTGATMQECARVLKNAGVRRVIGFTVGRGVLYTKRI